MLANILLGITAIGGIVYLECEALKRGINGRMLRISCILIAALGGMSVTELLHFIGG